MMPEFFQTVLPPEWEQYVNPLPKAVLPELPNLKRGDKKLIMEVILQASMTVVNDDLWPAIPAAEDAEELQMFSIELQATCTTAQRKRLQELLHGALPHTLLLLLHVGANRYLSARHGECSICSPLPHVLPQEFAQAMNIRHGAPANLRALYNRWLCALHSLSLLQHEKLLQLVPTMRFRHFASPEQAAPFLKQLNALLRELATLDTALKTCRMPGKRVELANRRHATRQLIISLTTTPS